MSLLMFLQITTILCFLYALKIKMYKTNLIGFVTILTFLVSFGISYFIPDFKEIHYLMLIFLLLFIVVYNTYKNYKKRRTYGKV